MQVVRYSASQPADRFHFLGLAKLLLQLSAIRNVESHANCALQLATGITQRLDVARVGPAFPLHMERCRIACHCATMSRDRLETLIGRLKIFQQRHSNDLILLQSEPRQSSSHCRSKAKIFSNRPKNRRQLLNQNAKACFAIAYLFFSALSLDGQSDLAADRPEKLEIALGVRIFVLVMLNDEYAYRRRRRSKRYPKPTGRWRADELHFSLLSELVERFLRDQHGAARAIHVRRTTSPDLLRRRRDVKLVYEEWEKEHFRRRLVQRDETIFSVE